MCVQGWLPEFLTDIYDPRYDAEDKIRECMLRCLQANADAPTKYSNLAFVVYSPTHQYTGYRNKCRCTTTDSACETFTERDTNKQFQSYRIYDTAAAPTQRPTPVGNYGLTKFATKNYTFIGDGQCRSYKWLPDVSNAAV